MYFQFLWLSLLFLHISNCDTTHTIQLTYHPYLAKKLCPLAISGALENITSISIVLDRTNVFDVEEKLLDELSVHTDPDSEYRLPFRIDLKDVFSHKIPCRNQTIRIRYRKDEMEKAYSFFFTKDKKQKFIIKRKSKSGELYVEI